MVLTELQGIAEIVLNRARAHGYVLSREIREELEAAGMAGERWKEVVVFLKPRVRLRQGRYHYVPSITARMRAEHGHLLQVKRAARQLLREYKAAAVERERRTFHRTHFIQPVRVTTADGRTLNFLSQDVSLAGIRMIGATDLRGQKVRVLVPALEKGGTQWTFTIQVVWTAVVGDGLIENGGIFVNVNDPSRSENSQQA